MKYLLALVALVGCSDRLATPAPKPVESRHYVHSEFCYDGTVYIQMYGHGVSVKFKDGATVSCQ